MANSTTAASMRARELCRQFPDAGNLTLAKKLYKEFGTHYANLESARGAIRTIRGVNGEKHREAYKKKVPWTPGVAGQKPKLPPSQAGPWLPVTIDGPARILSLSDIHCPYHNEGALSAAVEHGKRLKPDVVVLLGDIIDFYAISRFERHPAKRNAVEEINATRELLAWLRSKFRSQRFIYLCGNHENRWQVYIWNRCEELYSLNGLQLHNVLDCEKYGIEFYEDRPIMAGKLPMLHGHEKGRGFAAPVNQARGAFNRTIHSVLEGHGHRTSTHCEPDMFGREIACWSQGHLSDPHPAYARINKFNWGFAFVEVAKDGQFNVQNIRINKNHTLRTA